MKDGTYITIQSWMRTELDLKGNDLIVYAIIFGFSQTENTRFTGSLQYLADWCGATKQGILKNIKNLLDRGLIEKNEEVKNGIKFVEYYATKLNTPLNKVEYPIKQSLTNNIDNNQTNNTLLSKDNNSNIQNFDFGQTKPKKENLFTKCINLIDSYDFSVWGNIRKLLVDYLQFRLSVKDKPLYFNMWKGMLNKLSEMCDDNVQAYESVIKQSIERGYLSFYPVNSYAKDYDVRRGKSWEDGVRSDRYTAEELAELEELDKQREAQGLRTRF